MSWQKLSDAIGSGTPDPSLSHAAAAQNIPAPVVSNKPAPGQTGPRGLSPRTTYTRVNTGAPPTPDAGASSQKSMSPRGMEMLPAKVAHKESLMPTHLIQRPTLHDLIKEAMESTASKFGEAAPAAPQVKTAEAVTPPSPDSVSTEYVQKIASALEYMVKQADIGTNTIEPGKGPNALEVLETSSNDAPFETSDLGSSNKIPQNPPTESSGVAKDAPNATATNDMVPGEQGEGPMAKSSAVMEALKGLANKAAKGAKAGKEVVTGSRVKTMKNNLKSGEGALPSAIRDPMRKTLRDETAKTVGARSGLTVAGGLGAAGAVNAAFNKGDKKEEPKKDGGKDKEASLRARNRAALGLDKKAEDAINPAHISAGSTQTGATPPEGVSKSEEGVPSEPSDVTSQKQMISSNEAAMNITKRDAKADARSDANLVLSEPMHSSSTDKTLNAAFDRTQEAGAKIASDRSVSPLTKTAASQAILAKLAEAACAAEDTKKKKEKQSTMGGSDLSTPSGQSGFAATSV